MSLQSCNLQSANSRERAAIKSNTCDACYALWNLRKRTRYWQSYVCEFYDKFTNCHQCILLSRSCIRVCFDLCCLSCFVVRLDCRPAFQSLHLHFCGSALLRFNTVLLPNSCGMCVFTEPPSRVVFTYCWTVMPLNVDVSHEEESVLLCFFMFESHNKQIYHQDAFFGYVCKEF